jgi:two-component system cell cycle response regulator
MSSKLEILIVEDSKTQALRLRHVLEREGYEVRTAVNGLTALTMIRQTRPGLVISDVMMPEMGGYELCSAIKQDPALKDIPVILVTTLSDPTDVIQALKVGADNFLTKPYDDEVLVSRIRYTAANLELRRNQTAEMGVEVYFAGQKYFLNSSRIQMIDLLLSTYESAIQKNRELYDANRQLKDALASIKALEANYLRLLETNQDAIVVLDESHAVHYANRAAQIMFGSRIYSLKERAQAIPVIPGECLELEMDTSDGKLINVDARVSETDWDGRRMALVVLRDITEAVRMRRELQQLSLTDELSGLYNRRGFALLAEREILRAERTQSRLFLLFADLDGMKYINDSYGHKEGDLAIIDTAGILRLCFRNSDIIARMGGDEFAVLGVMSPDAGLNEVRGKLAESVATFNALGSRKYGISISSGVELWNPEKPESLDEILKRADATMYENKRSRAGLRVAARAMDRADSAEAGKPEGGT